MLATLNNRTDYLFLRIGSLELLAAMSPDSLTSRTFLERLTDPEEPEILRLPAGHALASQPPPVEDWLPKVAALANHSHPIPVRDLAAQIRAARTPGV